MKHILTLFFAACLLAATVSTTFAQSTDVSTVCNEKSGLAWRANTEPDMDKYRVYASNSPIDVTVDNAGLVLMEIPHDLSNVTPNEAGESTISKTLNSQLAEGPKYFRVSALDKVGNESPLSLEVGCTYDKIPGTPLGVTIILQLK